MLWFCGPTICERLLAPVVLGAIAVLVMTVAHLSCLPACAGPRLAPRLPAVRVPRLDNHPGRRRRRWLLIRQTRGFPVVQAARHRRGPVRTRRRGRRWSPGLQAPAIALYDKPCLPGSTRPAYTGVPV